MSKHRVSATFYPDGLAQAFYMPQVEVDGGVTTDPVDVACKLWLLGQVDYPKAARVALHIEGLPEMSAALGKALFGRRHINPLKARHG